MLEAEYRADEPSRIDDLQRVRWVELLRIQEEQTTLLRDLMAARR